MKRQYRSSEAFEDPVMDPETGVYGKLASEKVRAHRKETDQGEYEDVLAARKEYHVCLPVDWRAASFCDYVCCI